jgi:HAE1 family hydrophobic/amphiphilic exporter-1
VNLPRFSVSHPVTTLMVFAGVIIIGLVALFRLPIDQMPDIEPPFISVITTYPGAAAEDVERKVTKVIENNLSIVNNLKELTSVSRESLSVVRCQFEYGADLEAAANDIRDRLEFAKRDLPQDAEEPVLFKFSTAMFPILLYGVTATESYGRLRDIINDEVADPLKRLPGVGAAQAAGGLDRQINVQVDPERLLARGLTFARLAAVLAAENLTLPAGSLKVGVTEYLLRVPGEFSDVEQIRQVVVRRGENGEVVYLKDVADVEDAFKEPTYVTEFDGRPGMIVFVQKRSGANTVEVARQVKETMAKDIIPRLPADVTMSVLLDSSEQIVDSIHNLTSSLYFGGALVIAVTLFFLRRLTPSLIIASTIPFSLICSFIFLFAAGYSLNLITLASLILAIGMVVDNAVVILENVVNHLERGERPEEAAEFGASEVGLAVMASTLTTVAVFFPLIFMRGIVGVMFKDLALVVCVTLLASLFTALTATPMLGAKLLGGFYGQQGSARRQGLARRFYDTSERMFDAVERFYGATLRAALKHRLAVVLGALFLFLASVGLFYTSVGTQFFASSDTGMIQATVELPVGTRVEETAQVARQLVGRLAEVIGPEERTHFYFRAGQTSEGFSSASGQMEGSHVITLGARLVSKNERRRGVKEIGEQVTNAIRRYPQVLKLSVGAQDPINSMLLGGGKEISFEVEGHDLASSDALARQIFNIVRDVPGVRNPVISREVGRPELRVVVDRVKAAALGLNISDIAQTLRMQFYGYAATRFREAEHDYDVFPRLAEPFRKDVADLANTVITTPTGAQVPLANIATIEETTSPLEIERRNQQRVVKVQAETQGRPLGQVTADIKDQVDQLKVPKDLKVTVGGLSKEQAEAFSYLKEAFVLGMVLVYMIMASQFESLRDPFIVMFSVPFAFVGVALLFWLIGMPFDVAGFLGLVMLVGVVVNNAIVLVDYINILRARGRTVAQAVVEGGERRLRPVLITSITTIFGLIPLAVSTQEGAEEMRSLAVAVIGGLTVSMLVTLVLVPVIYSLFEERRGLAKGARA